MQGTGLSMPTNSTSAELCVLIFRSFDTAGAAPRPMAVKASARPRASVGCVGGISVPMRDVLFVLPSDEWQMREPSQMPHDSDKLQAVMAAWLLRSGADRGRSGLQAGSGVLGEKQQLHSAMVERADAVIIQEWWILLVIIVCGIRQVSCGRGCSFSRHVIRQALRSFIDAIMLGGFSSPLQIAVNLHSRAAARLPGLDGQRQCFCMLVAWKPSDLLSGSLAAP